MKWQVVIALSALAWPSSHALGQTGFDPREYQLRVTGDLTEALVLGTMHLSGLDDE
jgi:hypothetical protein